MLAKQASPSPLEPTRQFEIKKERDEVIFAEMKHEIKFENLEVDTSSDFIPSQVKQESLSALDPMQHFEIKEEKVENMSLQLKREIKLEDHEVDTSNDLFSCRMKQESLSALEPMQHFEIKEEKVENGLHFYEYDGLSEVSSVKPKVAAPLQSFKLNVRLRRCTVDLIRLPHKFIKNESFGDFTEWDDINCTRKCSVMLVRLPYQIFVEASVETIMLRDQKLLYMDREPFEHRTERLAKLQNGYTYKGPEYFECSHCSQHFRTTQNLNRHIEAIHTKSRPFKCSKCSWKSKRRDHLLKHIRSVHEIHKHFKTCEYRATLAKQKTPSRPLYLFQNKSDTVGPKVLSQNSLGSENIKLCQCSNCKAPLNGSTKHLKLYNCKDCGLRVERKDQFNLHIQQHRMEGKPFRCSVCGAKFAKKSNLKAHCNTVHKKLKPHHCSECNSSFGKNSHLLQHVAIVHRKLKPFQCSVCGFRCGREEHFALHMKLVHGKVKTYPCSLCQTGLKTKLSLHQHLLTVHHISRPYCYLKGT